METLHDEIIQYFAQHPYNADGNPLEYFAAIPRYDYLETMTKNGEYEDHITLQAAVEIFNVEILVVSIRPLVATKQQ